MTASTGLQIRSRLYRRLWLVSRVADMRAILCLDPGMKSPVAALAPVIFSQRNEVPVTEELATTGISRACLRADGAQLGIDARHD